MYLVKTRFEGLAAFGLGGAFRLFLLSELLLVSAFVATGLCFVVAAAAGAAAAGERAWLRRLPNDWRESETSN